MFKKYLVFLLFSLILNNVFSGTIITDSLRIEKLFNYATSNPSKSDSVNKLALKIVQSNSEKTLLKDIYYYNYAKSLFRTAQLDSAIIIAKKGIELNENLGYAKFKYHNILGSVYVYKNEHKKSVKQFQIAIQILEENNKMHQSALIKNNLANVFFSLNDYESSYKYSKEAYTILKNEGDSIYLPSITSIYAVSAINIDKKKEGENLANEGLFLSKKYNNVIGLIVSNYCLGDVFVGKKDYTKALNYYNTSLEISNKINHRHFVNLNKLGLLNTHNFLKNYDKAIFYGKEALEETKKQKNENTLYAIHKKLGIAYEGKHDFKKAYFHMNKAHKLFSKTASVENKKTINEILIKYETVKKEREIAENKLIKAEDEIKLSNRKTWIIGLTSLILGLIFMIYYFYRRNTKKIINLKKEKEHSIIKAILEGEEKERERISYELHDGVASSITGVKIKLEHYNATTSNPEINSFVKKLSEIHEETRRISHNLMPISFNQNGLIKSLELYCIENTSLKLKIIFSNLIKEKVSIKPETSSVIYRVVQELIHNIQKHAESTVCYVQTSINEKELNVSIEDEGIGFNEDNNSQSQGLKSIRKRIHNIGGEINIDSTIGEGTLVVIHLIIE